MGPSTCGTPRQSSVSSPRSLSRRRDAGRDLRGSGGPAGPTLASKVRSNLAPGVASRGSVPDLLALGSGVSGGLGPSVMDVLFPSGLLSLSPPLGVPPSLSSPRGPSLPSFPWGPFSGPTCPDHEWPCVPRRGRAGRARSGKAPDPARDSAVLGSPPPPATEGGASRRGLPKERREGSALVPPALRPSGPPSPAAGRVVAGASRFGWA